MSGRRILVIEDDADSAEVLQLGLEALGQHVAVAKDGAAGIALATETKPDVVLVDLGLPGLDGYEVVRQIRSALGESVRVIALTGYGRAEDRRRTAEAGFDGHLMKPIGTEAILALLPD
ncbi:MAG TPA: response regulator [Methylomirabilota bacterium]|nr:response regulator [Methylomirabilota bacterium]